MKNEFELCNVQGKYLNFVYINFGLQRANAGMPECYKHPIEEIKRKRIPYIYILNESNQ
jgi:hypothetical protein